MKTLKFIGLVGVISGFTTIACGGYVEGDKDSLVDSGLAGDTGATDYAKDCKANNGTYVGGKVNSEGKAIGECYITSATDNTDGYDSVLFSGYHQMAQDCLAVGHATFVISILIGEHSTTGECRTAPLCLGTQCQSGKKDRRLSK